MKTDIEISRENEKIKITKVAEKIDVLEDDLELYGKYKAKFSSQYISKKMKEEDKGKLILVTAVNPTPAGEGKTTMTIGLGDALNKLGKKTVLALREPSLGPVFGIKGGATGGGYAQVVPMDEINLHFTGDFHAIGAANNLMCATLDNHIFQGNELDINIDTVKISRVVDMNDRTLRNVIIGLGDKNGVERKDTYKITVASEVMAIFCLARDIFDLKEKLGDILVAYSNDNKPIYARDLEVNGAMAALLKDAFRPNLVQTLEHNPVIIHGGPFANIAHGCNSVVATNLALKLGEYVVTEAGFGADLGAEKFLDIKCRKANLNPNAIVLVATVRALKYNGGINVEDLEAENVDALKNGLCNLERHINNLKKFNVPVIVTLNKFFKDTDAEIEEVKKICNTLEVDFEISEAFEKGGEGSIKLAEKLTKLIEKNENENKDITLKYIYNLEDSIKKKITKVACEIYGAKSVKFEDAAEKSILEIEKMSKSNLPICIAKTQMSFSDNAKLLGAPTDYEFNVRDVSISNGAGFIVVYAGNIMTMPGLSKNAAYKNIDIDENGDIIGIF